MTAPEGADVGLYVDLVSQVETGDVIQTHSGRRYLVTNVRVQLRGAHAGRQHLRCVVGPEDTLPASGVLHSIRWYRRGKRRSP